MARRVREREAARRAREGIVIVAGTGARLGHLDKATVRFS
jgi:hypothetical protein